MLRNLRGWHTPGSTGHPIFNIELQGVWGQHRRRAQLLARHRTCCELFSINSPFFVRSRMFSTHEQDGSCDACCRNLFLIFKVIFFGAPKAGPDSPGNARQACLSACVCDSLTPESIAPTLETAEATNAKAMRDEQTCAQHKICIHARNSTLILLIRH